MQRHQRQLHALGSDVLFTIASSNTVDNVNGVFDALTTMVEIFEQRFSRFLPSSELTHFNHHAGKPVKITKEFRALLTTARAFSEATDGLYTPFILPALQRAGYIGSWPSPDQAASAPIYSSGRLVSIDELEIGESWAKIADNSALDFGGIGKGYLLDMLAAELERRKYTNYWLSLGGDIICSGFDVDGQPWTIAVAHAVNESEIVGSLSNASGQRLAIATSGVTKRKGTHGGKAWHHLIDPRTAQPADTDILTATVTAKDAAAADVYAKCVVIVGSVHSMKFIKAKNIQQYVLQAKHNQATLRIMKRGLI